MSGAFRTSLLAQLAHKDAALAVEQQARKAVEERAATQIQKLSDNNTALARMNHRLTAQLERVRAEHDRLAHLEAGRAAVARAKEAEMAQQVQGLKELLKESLEERSKLHAKLMAKQEIANYLEWRLAQVEQVAAGQELPPATLSAARPRAPAPPAPADASVDSQSSSVSGRALPRTLMALGQRSLVGIPPAAWALPSGDAAPAPAVAPAPVDSDKENVDGAGQRVARTPGRAPPLPAARQATPLAPPRRAALADITPRGAAAEGDDSGGGDTVADSTPAVHGGRGATPPLSDGEQVSEAGAELEAALAPPGADGGAATEETESTDVGVSTCIPSPQKRLFQEDDGEEVGNEWAEGLEAEMVAGDEGGRGRGRSSGAGSAAATLRTPSVPRAASPAAAAASTPATGLRSSGRLRRSVSYALPAVNRKLRQGDPFTFGDPLTYRKKTPNRTRTKPRAKFAGGGRGERGGASRLSAAAVAERDWASASDAGSE